MSALNDLPADKTTTATLQLGSKFQSDWHNGFEADWFRIELEAGKSYIFRAFDGIELDFSEMAVALSIFDANGKPLRSVTNFFSDLPAALGFTAPTSGTYYLSAQGSAYSPISGTYSVLAELRTAPDDIPDNASTPVTIQVGVTASAEAEVVGDTDYFRFHADAGKSYQLQLPGATGSLPYGNVDIVDSAGQIQPYTVAFQPQVSGDYYVQHVARGVIPYSVRVAELQDDFGNSRALASGQLVPGPALEVKTNYRYDPDYIRVNLEANTVYVFRASGGDLEYGSINLWGLDTGASAVASIYPNGSGRTYVAPATGAYVLSVDTESSKIPTTAYQVQLSRLGKISTQPSAGDDLFVPGASTVSLDGGAGTDAVYIAANASSYTLTRTSTGFSAQNADRSVSASLANIERVHFSDKSFAMDLGGAGGQAYRLYEAAFNRTPDKAGVGFWMSQLDKGMSLSTVAGAFVASTEFVALAGGAQTNTAFVELLYKNILDRAGEQAGVDYWVKAMDAGVGRADVLMFFSESPENQNNAVKVIGNGFEYIPYG